MIIKIKNIKINNKIKLINKIKKKKHKLGKIKKLIKRIKKILKKTSQRVKSMENMIYWRQRQFLMVNHHF